MTRGDLLAVLGVVMAISPLLAVGIMLLIHRRPRASGQTGDSMSDDAVEQAAAEAVAEATAPPAPPVAPAIQAGPMAPWVLPALAFSALGVFFAAMLLSWFLSDDGKLFGQLALVAANGAMGPAFLYFFGSSHGQQVLTRMLGSKGEGQP